MSAVLYRFHSLPAFALLMFFTLLLVPGRSRGQTVSTKITLSGTFPGQSAIIPPSLNLPDDQGSAVVYPTEAQKEGIEGTVKLNLLIGTDGNINSSFVVENGGDSRLLHASVEGFRKATFTPGSINGVLTEMWVVAEVKFQLATQDRPGGKAQNPVVEGAETADMTDVEPADVAEPAPAENDGMDNFEHYDKSPTYDVAELSRLLEYPKKAIKNEIEGHVTISVRLSSEGKPMQVVVRQVSDSIFIAPTLKAAWELTYTPAWQKGQPVASWLTFNVSYKFGD